MPRIKFRDIRLSKANKERLVQINSIIGEYQRQGYRLTLRQLYYQLVSRDVIPNQQSEYSKLSKLLKEGRMAGIVDWAAIEDRLRVAEKPASWETPRSAMDSLIAQYERPRMKDQKNYLEVWVEKDALSGVLSVVTEKYHVPILVNRGYSSVSAIFDSYKRFKIALEAGQKVTILYLGDFDPSGIDMIRDVRDRPLEMLLSKSGFIHQVYKKWVEDEFNDDWQEAHWNLLGDFEDDDDCYIEEDGIRQFDVHSAFIKKRFTVVPIALTRSQIDEHEPPPNPAKKTDPRSDKFIETHGDESWEVDALRPEVLNTILTVAITSRIDIDLYDSIVEQEQEDIDKLEELKSQLPEDDEDALENEKD
jgi:hypothetical protein